MRHEQVMEYQRFLSLAILLPIYSVHQTITTTNLRIEILILASNKWD